MVIIMKKISLTGTWNLRCKETKLNITATVPGSVLSDLLANGKIEDPFWRTNEYKVRDLFENEYEYTREFQVDKDILEYSKCELVCEGLDTLASIFVNGKLIKNTDNMHRSFKINVKDVLKEGLNEIRIVFSSPLEYLRKAKEACPDEITYFATGCMPGNNFLRKAHHMFGWDWGPQLPDAGIWRNIQIEAYSDARILDVDIEQIHEDSQVKLFLKTKTEWVDQAEYFVEHELVDPQGLSLDKKSLSLAQNCDNQCVIIVKDPQIWWPNGYGEQPLYTLRTKIIKNNQMCDEKTVSIGLRTVTVSTQKDEWGNEFCFAVNGMKIFAMGADYIPEDSILPRVTFDTTQKLLKSCVKANFNCVRVWGGGYYPDDYFYDICDQYGLLVWQDLMFACNVYVMTPEFENNIIQEVAENVRRIKHHACLALWCGNNEMEEGWANWDRMKHHSHKLRSDYLKQFEFILPDLVKKEDPHTFYWKASPSSTGNFDDPNDENRGDVHYWDVWHSLVPFTAYREHFFRFCSEFGFQAFPTRKTIETFTLEEDLNIFSPVMESHQKNGTANGRIMFYLADYYRYPKNFDSMIYISQLLQSQAIKYGVEHWRRHRGRCMGAIYWQLNDCWPVASWSSIDYAGRWKALHYGAKKFFAPRLVTIEDEGTLLSFFAHNETLCDYEGMLTIYLKKHNHETIKKEQYPVNVAKLSVEPSYSHDFTAECDEFGKENLLVYYTLEIANKIICADCVLFAKAKQISFKKPNYDVNISQNEKEWLITIKTDIFTHYVELDFKNHDVIFSDNYFNICTKDGVTVSIEKDQLPSDITEQQLKDELLIQSVAESY